MSAVGVIPARYQSTRFPGKVLTPIAGIPMLQRVFEGASRAKRLREVVVATEDRRVAEACSSFGARVFLTCDQHANGSERVAEVARRLDDEIVVNIQGDEPLIEGFAIDATIEALLEDPELDLATLAHPVEGGAGRDPNRVKVVFDERGVALSFSRTPTPTPGEGGVRSPGWQHVGLYAYRRKSLLEIVSLPRTATERTEGLEQLRALENGYRIFVARIEAYRSVPVDVPEDVARVEAILARQNGEKA